MDTSSDFEISIEDLNTVLGTMDDAYSCLSNKFYLPKRNSKAITKEYLMKLFLKKSHVLKVPVTIQRNYIEYHCMTTVELLSKLEGFLRDHNLPPSGCDSLHQPDYQWVFDVIAWVDKKNELKIPRNSTPSLNSLKRTVDSEIIELIQDRPLKKNRRNFFTPTKEEKLELKIEKLNQKIRKKEKNLERIKSLEKAVCEQHEKLKSRKVQVQMDEAKKIIVQESDNENIIEEIDQNKMIVLKEKMTPIAKMISDMNIGSESLSFLSTYLIQLASKPVDEIYMSE